MPGHVGDYESKLCRVAIWTPCFRQKCLPKPWQTFACGLCNNQNLYNTTKRHFVMLKFIMCDKLPVALQLPLQVTPPPPSSSPPPLPLPLQPQPQLQPSARPPPRLRAQPRSPDQRAKGVRSCDDENSSQTLRTRLLIGANHPSRPRSHHASPTPTASPSSPVLHTPSDDEKPLLRRTRPVPSSPTPKRYRAMSSSNTSSAPAEKHTRRGGTGPHVLRAGGPVSSSAASSKRAAGPASNMPAPPPKVVMTNAVASSGVPEEGLDGSVTMSGGAPLKDKDSTRSRSGSIRNKDMSSTSSSAPSEAATALLIRERDDRIASLERELQIMEHEFHRELDKLAKSESETATFWQAKHSAQHQQFLRADTDLRLLRAEVEARERERDELRTGFEVMRRTLAERESETRGLRQQVRGLKEFVSTSTRTDGQQAATDESLGESMALLANGLQNWVITNFRRAKLRPLEELDEAARAEASELLPMFEDLVTSGKKVHLLQSIVSRVLVEDVFEAYYAGLASEQAAKFREMEGLLGSFAASDEAVNQWRASTLALVHREAQNQLHDETSTLIDTLATRILRLLDSILQPVAPTSNTTIATSPSDARDTSLRALLTSALDLSRLLSVQRAVLRVYMPPILPHQRVLFDPEIMEDVGGEDEDALDQREIACVVFPGLIKSGDESGGHLQVYRNVVTKARVLCGEER